MKAQLFNELVQAPSIFNVIKMVQESNVKTTLQSDKKDFADFILKQYRLQKESCNHKQALATQKRRACQFLGGTDRQYQKMWDLELQAQSQ